MMETLLWIYFVNLVFLINHELDSAYWKEWDLFRLPGGITGFLALHFPLFSFFLYGLLMIYEGARSGLIISMLLSLSGVFAFAIHIYFLRKGRDEFNTPASKFILASILILSIAQLIITSGLLI